MSIATQITALQTDKTNISNAITTMGGTVTSGDGFDNFASDILTIPQGGGTEIPPKDVNFYDYDGTVLYAYTLAEAHALQALPALPTGPTGYTASSWTETLNTLNNISGPINVGVNYTTSKRGTEFDIVIGEEKDIYGYCPASGTIDWGDGTSTWSTYGLAKHTYAQSGEYTVTINRSNTGIDLIGKAVNPYTEQPTSINAPPLMLCSEAYNYAPYTSYLVKRIRIGNNVPQTMRFSYSSLESILIACQITTFPPSCFLRCSFKHITLPSSATTINSYAFQECIDLQSIVVPTSITSIGTYCFDGCYNLKSIFAYNISTIQNYTFQNCYNLTHAVIPSVTTINNRGFTGCRSLQSIVMPLVTSIGTNAFYTNYSLQSVTLPTSLTSIANTAFGNCTYLMSVTIPSSVTSIGSTAFSSCSNLNEVIVKRTSPPTLGNNAFQSNYSTRKIYVPYSEDHSILNTYKTTSGWLTYASSIVESPAP